MTKNSLESILKEGQNQLELSGLKEAKLDSWYLFSYCFNISRAEYLLRKEELLLEEKKECKKQYDKLIEERKKHVPLQYILGTQEFMGLSFIVNKHVLIPRQDTEVLVEEVLKQAKKKRILDLCTGSGCIIISLAKLGDLGQAWGSDISKEALLVAKENAYKNQAAVEWIESDLFTSISGKFDIIVSNPPYIETEVISTLSKEVRDFEPRLALDGKEDGLFFYRIIIQKAKQYLETNGMLYLEIGYNQAKQVTFLMKQEGYKQITVIKDLSSLDRVIYGTV